MISVFKFIYMVCYTYRFTYVEPDLPLWDDAHLVVMHDLINVFLNLVLKYFVGNFCIFAHQRNWFVVFFFCCLFTSFCYQDNTDSMERI